MKEKKAEYRRQYTEDRIKDIKLLNSDSRLLILIFVMIEVIFLSFVTASMSFTVTETKMLLPLREWARTKNSYLGELLSCGYCFAHWVAFLMVAIYRPKLFESWWLLDYFLIAIAIAWLGAFQWIIMCWLMEMAGK